MPSAFISIPLVGPFIFYMQDSNRFYDSYTTVTESGEGSRMKQSNATLLHSQSPFCFLALYFPGIICPILFFKPVSFQKLVCLSLISFHPRTKNNQTQHDVVPHLRQRRISSCAAGGSSPRGRHPLSEDTRPPWWGCTADLGRKHSDRRRTL